MTQQQRKINKTNRMEVNLDVFFLLLCLLLLCNQYKININNHSPIAFQIERNESLFGINFTYIRRYLILKFSIRRSYNGKIHLIKKK